MMKLPAIRIAWPGHVVARVCVGVDIGSSAVKVVRAEGGGRPGAWRVTAAVIQELADGTTNPAALQQALIAAGLKEKDMDVRLSVAGPDIITRCLTLPEMTSKELDGAIRFESETYIPFPLNEVILDRQVLETLGGKKMRVLLVAGKREAIEQRLKLAESCKIQPTIMDVDALAVVNAYLADQEGAPASKTTAVVHIGAHLTNVAVLQKGHLCCFTRDLSMAGQALSKALVEQLGVAPAQAEELKLRPGDREADVSQALRHGLEQLANELRLSFDFYESQFEGGVERVVLAGGTSLMPLVPPSLKEQLGLPVETWAPHRWLTKAGAQVSKETASRLAVCVGLVARGGV